jgi:hypothetical protein
MSVISRSLICVVLVAFTLTGCYTTPVRHLASDAALIKVGESKRNDVLIYLGEPDERIVLGDGEEKWLYKEYEHSMVKEAPLVGKYFGKPNYGTLAVTLKNEIVTGCAYGAWESDDDAWKDDFGWQEKNK